MSERGANQGLFRIYAVGWLIAAAFVATAALQVSDLPGLGIAIYLGIGSTLWGIDMVVTGGQPLRGHGLSHAVLVAAFALVWPLVIAALIVFLVGGVIKDLRR